MLMKTKIFYFILAALFIVSACSKDEVNGDKSPAQNANSTNVFFLNKNPKSLILAKTAQDFTIPVSRTNTTSEQTVNIFIENPYDKSLFEVPTSVHFAAGDDTVYFTVKVVNLELMKSYHIAFTIDFDQTQPYTSQNVYSRYELNLIQEDFAPYAQGTYTSLFFEDSWSQVLEYSPSTQVYRFTEPWGFAGYNVTFTWAGSSTTAVNMIGTVSGSYVVIKTGYVHSKYGMVSAYYKGSTYDAASKTFTFPITWRVSAGSFGTYADSYQITTLL
jgi:hypothetical protein